MANQNLGRHRRGGARLTLGGKPLADRGVEPPVIRPGHPHQFVGRGENTHDRRRPRLLHSQFFEPHCGVFLFIPELAIIL